MAFNKEKDVNWTAEETEFSIPKKIEIVEEAETTLLPAETARQFTADVQRRTINKVSALIGENLLRRSTRLQLRA